MHNTEVEIYSRTPLGAFVKLTAANWLIYFSNQILPNIICNIGKLQYPERQCNIEYLTNSVYVFNSNKGLGGNWGFSSAITDSKNLKQLTTTLSMWCTCDAKKQPLWPRPQPCVRKHFFTYFIPRQMENTTYFKKRKCPQYKPKVIYQYSILTSCWEC